MDTVADVEVRYGGKDSRVSDNLHISHVLSEMLNVVWCQMRKLALTYCGQRPVNVWPELRLLWTWVGTLRSQRE